MLATSSATNQINWATNLKEVANMPRGSTN